MSQEHIQVAILGSGPAGLTAGIYTARALLNPVVFLGNNDGGQLMITTEVENVPGFPEGIMGPEYIMKLKEQAQKFGAQLKSEHIHEVDFSKQPFRLTTEEHTYYAKTVIVATGAKARWLDIPSEKALMGFGVSACATCDGFFFRDKEVIIVGGGDSAMEEATFLTRFAKKVYLVHRRHEFRASKIMLKRAENNPKIEFMLNKAIEEIHDVSAKKVTGVRLRDTQSNQTSDLRIDGVFLAIGHDPNTSVFRGILDMDEKGYLLQRQFTQTNVPGVFACGDVVDARYRQAITAAGSGCQAAIDVERYLESHE